MPSHTPRKSQRTHLEDPEETEPGQPPVEPDQGPVLPDIPADPEHERSAEPEV